ncbi:MAG: tRNA epoxyqueuosine(34) reductase QueG [Myxococcaceae bacterium]|nr:tRNA epoxyqueuosine(34) reductase QueG [Myxococcaceae bacterium]
MLAARTLKDLAIESGFSLAGVARAEPLDPAPLDDWLRRGCHASMDWLARTRETRTNPSRLFSGAQSVLALAACYLTRSHRLDAPVAPVAQGRDYHAVMRDKLKALRRRLNALDASINALATVDTAPIQEKAWAARAGLGWLGKNGLIVTAAHGTRVVLATLILDREVDEFDAPLSSRCGDCRRCLDACPTGALLGDGRLDARRCLAWQTIEARDETFPLNRLSSAGASVFGCDLCQRACPWNRHDHACDDAKFLPRQLASLDLGAWRDLSEDRFDELTRGTALRRAGFDAIRRHARAAIDANASGQDSESRQFIDAAPSKTAEQAGEKRPEDAPEPRTAFWRDTPPQKA